MPNWCEGTLRIRGKNKDIINFLKDGVEKRGTELYYIKQTRRAFIIEAYFEDVIEELSYEDVKEVTYIGLDIKQAWDIEAEQLAEICKLYNLDMRIYGFEQGMEFNRDIEIIGGKITRNEDIEFNHSYVWDCICPNIGG